MLRLFRHHDIPDQATRHAIQRKQMSIICHHEDLVAEYRDPAIGADEMHLQPGPGWADGNTSISAPR